MRELCFQVESYYLLQFIEIEIGPQFYYLTIVVILKLDGVNSCETGYTLLCG